MFSEIITSLNLYILVVFLNSVIADDPIPGEAEETDAKEDVLCPVNYTRIDGSMMYSSKSSIEESETLDNRDMVTQVESFVLDDQFDYDNVILTRKDISRN